MTENPKDQSAVLASLMAAIPGTSFNTAVFKLIDALHYLVANTPPAKQPDRSGKGRCGDPDCCPPVHHEQPLPLRGQLIELASAWRRRGGESTAEPAYAIALAQCAAELDVVTIVGHASAVDLTDEYRIRPSLSGDGWEVLHPDGSPVLDDLPLTGQAKDVWERLNVPRPPLPHCGEGPHGDPCDQPVIDGVCPDHGEVGPPAAPVPATQSGPCCDRKPNHPGVCMTRCTATPGCTDPSGHRGRCTTGTYNGIGWRDQVQSAPVPGEQITGATFIRHGEAHHVVNDIEPGPGHQDRLLHWEEVQLSPDARDIDEPLALQLDPKQTRTWMNADRAQSIAAQLLSACARVQKETPDVRPA